MGRFRQSFKLFGEFVDFARENRVYWIVPLMLLLGLVGVVIAVGQSAAPLIYALF